MKQELPTSSKGNICEGEEGWINQLSGKVNLGDLIWVRIRNSSWWPAQVADANTVSESIKPCKRSVGEVLVRLYGSYEYVFVDPMKSRSEFEHVLNHSSCREILDTSLEEECRRFNPSASKRKGCKSREIKFQVTTARKLKRLLLENNQAIVAVESANVSSRKRSSPTLEDDGFLILNHQVEKKLGASPMSPTSVPLSLKKSRKLSDRRMKVMRSLGLVAPSGSPFLRIGGIYPYCD